MKEHNVTKTEIMGHNISNKPRFYQQDFILRGQSVSVNCLFTGSHHLAGLGAHTQSKPSHKPEENQSAILT
jgi:hypothetical protein